MTKSYWKYRELSLEAEIQKLRVVLLATVEELEDADPNRRAAIEFARAVAIGGDGMNSNPESDEEIERGIYEPHDFVR